MSYSEERVTYFAETDARNKRVAFGIKAKDRTKHIYVIGKTGMGKSTLLENMAAQDIKNGEGFAFIDPHGKTAELLLDYIPEDRTDDVLYFAPFDMEHPIAFNVMEDVGPDKRHLVLAGLMSAFKKIWVDAWSARMEYILSNTILALLEYPDATLLSVSRMLSDKAYRKKVVDNITDVSVKSFWVDEFAKYTDRFAAEATPAIQNKIGQFTANPLIRNIIGQPHSTFDLRKLMDERKIIIVNLSKGRVGEANANLLGSMLITKIYLAAMSRADVPESILRGLPNFYLYVDEFQSFANESFADILSEARKYKLNLTIAHQYIEQMSEEVRAAVFGNVGTMITFRIGATDAEVFEKEFAPQFTIEDLVNLGFAQVYLRLMIDGISSTPFSATTLPPIPPPAQSSREAVIAASRKKFGRIRSDIEGEIQASLAPIDAPVKREVSDSASSARAASSNNPPRTQQTQNTQTQGAASQGYSGNANRGRGDHDTAPKRGSSSESRGVSSAPVSKHTPPPQERGGEGRHVAERNTGGNTGAESVSLDRLTPRGTKKPAAPVSGSERPGIKNNKEPTTENLNALRSVLQKVMQSEAGAGTGETKKPAPSGAVPPVSETEKKTVYTREEFLARKGENTLQEKPPQNTSNRNVQATHSNIPEGKKKEEMKPSVPDATPPIKEIPENVLRKTLSDTK